MGRRELVGALVGVGVAVVIARIAYGHFHSSAADHPRLPPWLPPLPTPPKGPPMNTSSSDPTPGVPHPSLQQWAAVIDPIAAPLGIQAPYTMKWNEMEGGGNPCAIGYPSAKGPDGLPREMGIGQFYNPDDLQRLGATGAELRAYCEPGDQHDIVYKGKTIKGFSQKMIRQLTPAEMAKQATMLVGLIRDAMGHATADLMTVGAGPAWSKTRRDYWRMVKLQHGLPTLSREGLPSVKAYLGRAPSSWSEFRQALQSGQAKIDPKNQAEYFSEFPRIFDNAEQCASVFQEPSVA